MDQVIVFNLNCFSCYRPEVPITCRCVHFRGDHCVFALRIFSSCRIYRSRASSLHRRSSPIFTDGSVPLDINRVACLREQSSFRATLLGESQFIGSGIHYVYAVLELTSAMLVSSAISISSHPQRVAWFWRPIHLRLDKLFSSLP